MLQKFEGIREFFETVRQLILPKDGLTAVDKTCLDIIKDHIIIIIFSRNFDGFKQYIHQNFIDMDGEFIGNKSAVNYLFKCSDEKESNDFILLDILGKLEDQHYLDFVLETFPEINDAAQIFLDKSKVPIYKQPGGTMCE